MQRDCRICEHPDRAKIEARMLAGASDRSIERQYNLSHGGVSRHSRHIGRQLAHAAERREDAVLDQLLSTVDEATTAERFGLDAAKRDDWREIPRFTRGMREGVELTARLTGVLNQGDTRDPLPRVTIVFPPTIPAGGAPAELPERVIPAILPPPGQSAIIDVEALDPEDAAEGVLPGLPPPPPEDED